MTPVDVAPIHLLLTDRVRRDLERLADPEADGVPVAGPPSGY